MTGFIEESVCKKCDTVRGSFIGMRILRVNSYEPSDVIGPCSDCWEWKTRSKDTGKLIHYPDCWDTVAYPTLYDAMHEMMIGFNKKCPMCNKLQGPSE